MPQVSTSAPALAGHEPSVLDPIERVSESLFGLIMVLSFTGSLSVATAGRGEVREMLIGAIGCNLAWGLVDAIMYVMAVVMERRREHHTLELVHRAPGPEAARRILRDNLPDYMVAVLSDDALEQMRLKVLDIKWQKPGLHAGDVRNAISVFLIVVLSTLPVILPFLFIRGPATALRISNGVAMVMLFCGGWALGRFTGGRPWLAGLTMVIIGLVLVGITMALGG